MLRDKLFLIAVLIASLGLVGLIQAECPEGECGKKCSCGHMESQSKTNALNIMKNLSGYWETKTPGEDGKKEAVIYKITAAGTAVQETMFPGTGHEMVSMYYANGPKLSMTHYCALGNQPTMHASVADGAKKVVFNYASGSNLNPHDDEHIHGLELEILGKDHIRQRWTSMKAGKADFVKVMDLYRKG